MATCFVKRRRRKKTCATVFIIFSQQKRFLLAIMSGNLARWICLPIPNIGVAAVGSKGTAPSYRAAWYDAAVWVVLMAEEGRGVSWAPDLSEVIGIVLNPELQQCHSWLSHRARFQWKHILASSRAHPSGVHSWVAEHILLTTMLHPCMYCAQC